MKRCALVVLTISACRTQEAVPPPTVAADGGSVEAAAACEPARAAFEVAVAPRIDACTAPAHHAYGPMMARFDVDEDGHVSQERSAVTILTTAYGERVAFCVVHAVQSTPFEEKACAGKRLEIERRVR